MFWYMSLALPTEMHRSFASLRMTVPNYAGNCRNAAPTTDWCHWSLTTGHRPLLLGKHFGIQLGEESLVQALDNLGDFVFFNHEGQINFGCALRNHTNLLVGKLTKDEPRDSRLFPQIFADQANNGLA